MNASQQIRQDLQREQRVRSWRTVAAGLILAALVLAYILRFPAAPNPAPTDILAATVVGTFALFALVSTRSPHVRLGRWVVIGIAGVAIATPWLAVRAVGDGTGWGCALSVLAFGSTAVLAVRVALMSSARRFGGAPTLYGLAAALAAQFAVGLHCPMATAVHIGTHVLATGLVVFGVTKLAFWSPSFVSQKP